MKILKIDHVGVAVKDADAALKLFEGLLGLKVQGSETVPEQKVRTVFLPVGETEVELLEATAPDSPIARFLEKRGEGVQHIAFRVENIEEALAELEAKGVALIDRKPRIGAGGKKIAFLHPRDTLGVLVELSEHIA
jgi:methylmalonyl-CoA/ethylmalonyl-CoA epimerase